MKVSDKLVKVDESFSVNRYDNGYMVEVTGLNQNNEYKTVKLLVQTSTDLLNLVEEIISMEFDD